MIALSLLLAGCCAAQAAERPPDLYPSAAVVPTLPGVRMPAVPVQDKPLSLQFGVGHGVSTGLVLLGGLGVGAGLITGLDGWQGYEAYGAMAAIGAGGVLGALGGGVALGAATALRKDGGWVSNGPGWASIGVAGLGLGLAAVSNGNGLLLGAGLVAAPVAVGLAATQVVLNERARRRLRFGVQPMDEGAKATVSLRF